MNFKQYYAEIEKLTGDKPVGFNVLAAKIGGGLHGIEEVKVWRHVYDPPRQQAYFSLFDDRTSAYGDEYLVADISYCAAFDTDPSTLLYVLIKELMHVFDPIETWTNTRTAFVRFLKALQNGPVNSVNPAIATERRARWMAILVLCPKPLRDRVCARIATDNNARVTVASELGLPEWLIEVVLDPYYEEAYAELTQ